MTKAFKKHSTLPWHLKFPIKRVYESRGKYKRYHRVNYLKYKINRHYWENKIVN